MSERFGDWMQTASGRRFYPLDPRPEEVFIEDIAHHLAAINRFNGATHTPYSVAQHSVLVSQVCPGAYALWGLLHDAAEAYLGDVIRPVKSQMLVRWPNGVGSEPIRETENRVLAAIAKRFGLRETNYNIHIANADNVVLGAERRDLMTPTDDVWGCLEWLEFRINRVAKVVPWSFDLAKERFIHRFAEIITEPACGSREEELARAYCRTTHSHLLKARKGVGLLPDDWVLWQCKTCPARWPLPKYVHPGQCEACTASGRAEGVGDRGWVMFGTPSREKGGA